MRKISAHSLAQRFSTGSTVVYDEQLVTNTTAPVAFKSVGNAPTIAKASRTNEMDSPENIAPKAEERRLAQT